MQSARMSPRRAVAAIALAATLGACSGPPVPDSGAGVGFDNYNGYQAERALRDQQLSTGVNPNAISSEQITTGTLPPTGSGAPMTAMGQQQYAGAAVPYDPSNPGISDEQDFSAVSSRETIETDRQRLEANRQAYQVIQPAPLPERTGSGGPSVVDFALGTQNRVGEQVYARTNVAGQSRFDRNCAKYASADDAQQAFLKSGGPKKDSLGIDPDGDGFACYWDPTPFRRAVSN